MRPIRLVKVDKARPAVVLTRGNAVGARVKVTVAPITSTVQGLETEVPVGTRNGLESSCVVSCDNVTTVPVADLGRVVGYLYSDQEADLARALAAAFDLSVEDLG